MIRIGIDLGGTKIEIVALDNKGGELCRRRIATPAHDYDEILKQVQGLVMAVESELGDEGTVGIGTPGSLSPLTGLLRNSNSVVLNGKPLLADLERQLSRRVRLTNDANCFTLSEAVDGAGTGYKTVFGVIIGTGTGGGIAVDGRVLTGTNAIAGEWGHNPLPWPRDEELPSPPCYCGRRGCVETFLSGPGMVRDHAGRTGARLEPALIARRAREGEEVCRATLDRYVDRMARSLAYVINILDPDVIVLGGGMSNIDELYQMVPATWGSYVFSDHVGTRLKKAIHGDSSGVRGAAWLWDIDCGR